jgi:hypothetical protein
MRGLQLGCWPWRRLVFEWRARCPRLHPPAQAILTRPAKAPAPNARQPNTAGQRGGRAATQRIVPDAAFRLALPAVAPAAAPAPAASPAPTPSVLILFNLMTIHAGGPCYRSGQVRSSHCGAVANRAKAVDPE